MAITFCTAVAIGAAAGGAERASAGAAMDAGRPASKKIVATRLDGPYPSVAPWCAAWGKAARAASAAFAKKCAGLPEARIATECADPPGEPECDFASGVKSGPASATDVAAPWKSVRVFSMQANEYAPMQCALALETAAGVFIRANGLACGPDPTTGRGDVWELDSHGFVFDAPRETPLVLWTFSARLVDVKRVTAILLCGIGKSGRPTCASVATGSARWEIGARAYVVEWDLGSMVDALGRLVLFPALTGPSLPAAEKSRTGKYSLSFP